MIILLHGKKIEIKFLDVKKGDIKHSQANISLAKNNLNYTPKIELREGIKKLLNI